MTTSASTLSGGRDATSSTATPAAEHAAEVTAAAERPEDAGEVLGCNALELEALSATASRAKRSLTAASAAGAGETETVVLRALVLVAENVVGFLHFLEACFGLLVAGVAVGVMLASELAIRLLDVGLGGSLATPSTS